MEASSPPSDPFFAIVGQAKVTSYLGTRQLNFETRLWWIETSFVYRLFAIFRLPSSRKKVACARFCQFSFLFVSCRNFFLSFAMHVSLMQKLPMPQVSNFFYPFNTSLEEEIKRLFVNFSIETENTSVPNGKSICLKSIEFAGKLMNNNIDDKYPLK